MLEARNPPRLNRRPVPVGSQRPVRILKPTKEVPDTTTPDDNILPNAHLWTVFEVYDFISSIPGCEAYAEDFLMQEVDGEALLLIKPEHLVMALSMKLGPALKIVACIDALRPDSEQNNDHD